MAHPLRRAQEQIRSNARKMVQEIRASTEEKRAEAAERRAEEAAWVAVGERADEHMARIEMECDELTPVEDVDPELVERTRRH